MSVGRKIAQLRLKVGKTQQEISSHTGLAVSYLSRLENNRINPSVRTLGKLATALGVPISAFFDGETILEPGDSCPVSLSGRCILDQSFVSQGRKPKNHLESYSSEQLELLRLCNFLLHTGDPEVLNALSTMMKSLLALAASQRGGWMRRVIDQLGSSSRPEFQIDSRPVPVGQGKGKGT